MAHLPGVTPMDVVFSFDTTGSMSQALDEVKARVTDIIQKLQADIPGVRVGIIAHGDYCDAEHFYDIKSLDLSDNVADMVTFVNDTDGTGGGDFPECYELALREAKNMSWRPVGLRILVVIGDSYPHEADYPLNVNKIDWREELNHLAAMNVHIYGVQVQHDEDSSRFFNKLASATEGQHLQLENMGRVCEVIMGICYREQGPLMFKNFEAEIRQKEANKLGSDLEFVFGTLRHEVSRTSDITTILDRDENEVNMDDDDDDEVRGNHRPKLKRLADSSAVQRSGKCKLKQLRFSEVFGENDLNDGAVRKQNHSDNSSHSYVPIQKKRKTHHTRPATQKRKQKSKKKRFADLSFDSDDDDDDVDFIVNNDLIDSTDDDDTDEDVVGNGQPSLKHLTVFDSDSDDDDGTDDDDDDDIVVGNGKPNLKRLRTIDLNEDDDNSDSSVQIQKKRKTHHSPTAPQHRPRKTLCAARKIKKQVPGSIKRRSSNGLQRRRYREHVPSTDFKYNKLGWSPWHLAVCPSDKMKNAWLKNGQWRKVLSAYRTGRPKLLWRKDLLHSISTTRGCPMLFEMSTAAPEADRKSVVSYHMTKGVAGTGRDVFRLPWYRGVFRTVRPMINRAALRGCRIFVRWTRVTAKHVRKCRNIGNDYNYAWRLQPPRPLF